MAVFKKKKEEKEVTAEVQSDAAAHVGTHDATWVLKGPRITEKAALIAEKGVYVFNIDPRATKADVARAIADAYKVTPVKVNIAKAPRKQVTRRTRAGVTSGYKKGNKKAYVYLKKGETIQFV